MLKIIMPFCRRLKYNLRNRMVLLFAFKIRKSQITSSFLGTVLLYNVISLLNTLSACLYMLLTCTVMSDPIVGLLREFN